MYYLFARMVYISANFYPQSPSSTRQSFALGDISYTKVLLSGSDTFRSMLPRPRTPFPHPGAPQPVPTIQAFHHETPTHEHHVTSETKSISSLLIAPRISTNPRTRCYLQAPVLPCCRGHPLDKTNRARQGHVYARSLGRDHHQWCQVSQASPHLYLPKS